MCRFETTWDYNQLYFEELPFILLKLSEMETDGLVEINNKKLTITEAGKPFVRNVCMAFDVLLQRSKPETELFSMTV